MVVRLRSVLRPLAQAAGLVLLASPVLADSAGNAAELASYRAVNFDAVKTVSVAKIVDPQKHDLTEMRKGTFYGFAVTSNWQTVDPGARLGLGNLLRAPILAAIKADEAAGHHAVVKPGSFCLPDPGYAIHLQSEQGERDFVVCLECDEVTAYGPHKSSVKYALEPDALAQLREYYRAEFPDWSRSPER